MVLEERIAGAMARGRLDEACDAAIRGYGPPLLGYLRATLRDDAAAEDVFSTVCEKVWKGIAGFRAESSFRTWIYKLASRAALDFRRSRKRRRTRPLLTAEQSRLVAQVRTSTAEYRKTDAKDKLARLRERLTPAEQNLL